ncbi:MAG: hypothetical protein H6835_10775 [Planctomycetes bacterium]|nr:hypothetical protein [Planctomycetota bacterium]
MTTLAILALAAAALVAPQQPAPAAAKRPHVAWQRTFEDAMALREQTGLPLLIAVNMDGEVFNERFAGDVYHDPKFIESTRGYVCVVASPERHTERDYDALGNRVECPRFGGCTCSEHIDIEPELFRRWFDGKRNAPRHVGVDQDGKVLFDRFLDQSMQTAIDAIQKHRGTPPDSLAASDDVAALLARRDALARELLEARYRKADKASRSKLLDAAGAAKNEPFDLLRMGLFDTDPELARHAALALAKVGTSRTLIDIEDALARTADADVKQALLARLEALGRAAPEAARLAAHFAAAEDRIPAPWSNPWGDATFAGTRADVEAALDRAEAAIREHKDDQQLRLQLATAQVAYAAVLIAEGGNGVDLWCADAQRNVEQITREELQPEAQAARAISSWYLGDGAAVAKAAVLALAQPKSTRHPAPWLATTFLDVLLQLSAQQAYGRAQQDANASLRGELGRVQAALRLLDEHHAGGERGLLAGIGLLEFAGLRAEARQRLDALARRFPASVTLHERWRNRLLIDVGAENMRHAYARWVPSCPDQATAQWFAGYAALLAGERHTQDGRWIEAGNAYGDAIERFLDAAAKNPDYADTSHHFAVLALAGRAVIRHRRDDLRGAVDDLLQAAALRPASLDEDDGLQRKPRAIAARIEEQLRAAGHTELADRLLPLHR